MQKSKRVLANYIKAHIAHARLVLSITSRKIKTISPNKIPKQNLLITLSNHNCFLPHYWETHLQPWTFSLKHCKLLPSTNYRHAWTVKKCIFFFLIMGKVLFTPHFQKQLEQFGINVQKMPQLVQDCQIPARKVKRLGRRTSHWKSFLKMETLVQF